MRELKRIILKFVAKWL